jgi:hypothetical protein
MRNVPSLSLVVLLIAGVICTGCTSKKKPATTAANSPAPAATPNPASIPRTSVPPPQTVYPAVPGTDIVPGVVVGPSFADPITPPAATSEPAPAAIPAGTAITGKRKPAPIPGETNPPPASTDPVPPPSSVPVNPGEEVVKADVGVGIKGRSLDQYEGAVVTPAKAYFTVREKVVFQIQIPQAMQFFEAENGFTPKSHEEFMEKIIQANGIKLPELPVDARYVYDVENKELQVVRKRKQ